MILSNKINLIWYGRGNMTVAEDCAPLDLQSISEEEGNRPSDFIETVYRVNSNAQGDSAWQEWSSVEFRLQNKTDGVFTTLECGHLYIVIMQDADEGDGVKSLDIPEAITANSESPTIKIGEEALVVSPDNIVEEEEDDDEEPEAFTCLPDTFKKYLKVGVGELRHAEEEVISIDGILESITQGWTLGIPVDTPFVPSDDNTDKLALDDESGVINLNVLAKTLPEETKVRIEITSFNLPGAQDLDEFDPLGCWEGTVTAENKATMVKINSSEEVEEEEEEEEEVEEEEVEEEEEEVDPIASCLAFNAEDVEGSYRLRFTKPDEGEVAKEHFTLYTKTDSGETETEFEDAPDCVESILDDALIDEEGKFQVDFSLFFTATDTDENGTSALIIYPNDGSGTKLVVQGTSQVSGTFTATRVAIYDADRVKEGDDTPLCADFIPADGNQFLGASMV